VRRGEGKGKGRRGEGGPANFGLEPPLENKCLQTVMEGRQDAAEMTLSDSRLLIQLLQTVSTWQLTGLVNSEHWCRSCSLSSSASLGLSRRIAVPQRTCSYVTYRRIDATGVQDIANHTLPCSVCLLAAAKGTLFVHKKLGFVVSVSVRQWLKW